MELKKPKIAVVCNYQLNENRIGGMDRFFVAYDAACKKKGLEVDWFFHDSQPYQLYDRLKVYSGSGNIENYFLDNLRTKKKYYHIVITHFIALCTPFYKELKRLNNPYIIAVDHNPRPLNGFSLKKKIKNKIKGKFYGRYIDCYVGVSQYTVDNILKDYGIQLQSKTRLIYNGINTSLYQKKTQENHGQFIVASHLRESKGLQDLVEAVNLLEEPVKKKLSIDIFGEGPFESRLKELVEKYELQSQIKFKGSSSQLPNLFRNYSYMLQPTYMECFSLSIIESLAANVPVITTPVGGNLEVITHGSNGFIFSTKDILGLKQLLEKIINGSQLIEGNLYDLVEKKFSLDQMVDNHINLFPYEL